MYKKDFDLLLKSSIPKAVLLWGECDFFINFYAIKIKNLIKNNGEVDIFPLYFEEYNTTTIIEILSQQSLFSSSSLVILRLNKIKETTKKDILKFLDILKRNPNNYLIIEFYSDDGSEYGRNAKVLSAIFNSKDFVSVRFFNPTQNEATKILRQFATEYDLKIDDFTLNYLYDMQNQNINICVNELQKFTVFNGVINNEVVDKLSYGLSAKSIEELCETMLNRGDYLVILSKIKEEGLQDMDLIRTLQGYFYRLFQFFAYIKVNGCVDSTKILKYALPKQIEQKYANFAIKLREAQYLGIFSLLNEWRVNAINGKDKNSFANLIKLQAIIR